MAATNKNLALWTPGHDTLCLSCGVATETRIHLLLCQEAGRVETFARGVERLDSWLREAGTEASLHRCLVGYMRGRGEVTMKSLASGGDKALMRMAW